MVFVLSFPDLKGQDTIALELHLYYPNDGYTLLLSFKVLSGKRKRSPKMPVPGRWWGMTFDLLSTDVCSNLGSCG